MTFLDRTHNTCTGNNTALLVQTKISLIVVGTGQLTVDGVKYYVISMDSPLGAQLKGKRAGDTYALNGKTFTIKSVN